MLVIRLTLSCDKSVENIKRSLDLISQHLSESIYPSGDLIRESMDWSSMARPTFHRFTNLGQMDPPRNNFWGWHWGSTKFLEGFIRLNDIMTKRIARSCHIKDFCSWCIIITNLIWVLLAKLFKALWFFKINLNLFKNIKKI